VNEVGWDVIVVLVILLVGGFFSGAEMALVSLREGQVRSLSQRGKRGQRAAKLASDPNRFLSAVQGMNASARWTLVPSANEADLAKTESATVASLRADTGQPR